MVRVTLMVVSVLLACGNAVAQPNGGFAEAWRTSWGDPDLQGRWTNTTTTPMQRPDEYEGRAELTNEERAELDARANSRGDRTPPPGSTGAYNSFWVDRGTRTTQTSLVVDPPDGRWPALTNRVRARDAALTASRNAAPDSFTDLNLYDRLITRGVPGAMIPGFYNHNYQILQTPDYVVILVEMIHDARIIPLDGRPLLSPQVRQWMGDSRGHWEGDTLVVETTNVTAKADERAISNGLSLVLSGGEHMTLVERFRRVDAESIDYRFRVSAPTTYSQPWTASIPMVRLDAPIYEYACHEGNYGMMNILRGARRQERALASSK